MKHQPLITIGIPVYNVEQYVERAILSALEQDFNEIYEILVVDDCGEDRSMDIVAKLCVTHSKGSIIRRIKHDGNKGLGSARNTIIENALGKYLFFLDSDDWMNPTILTSMFNKVLQVPNVNLVVGGVVHVYNDDYIWQRTHYSDRIIKQKGAGAYVIAHNIEIIHTEWWGKLWSMDFIRRLQLRCEHRIMEDMLPHFIACAESECIAWVKDIAIYYTFRQDSIMSTSRGKKVTDELVFAYTDTIKKMQLLINKYHNVEGIFDLYMMRIIDSVKNLNDFELSTSQQLYVADTFSDFLFCISNIKQLHNKQHKLLYFMALHKQTYSRCIYIITKFQDSLLGRVLRNMLNVFF